MAMAKKRFKPFILFTQAVRRNKNKNHAFKVAQKEARQFARDVSRRNRARQKRENKLSTSTVCWLLGFVFIACGVTHFLTRTVGAQ